MGILYTKYFWGSLDQLRTKYELELEIGIELEFYLLDNSRSYLNAYSLESFIEEETFLAEYAELLISSGVGLKSHSENGLPVRVDDQSHFSDGSS